MTPHEKEHFWIIDRFTNSVMDQVSRRGFLKGVGAIGIALIGTFFGIGSQTAEARIQCPPDTFGDCDNCLTVCHYYGSGDSFACYCASCNCFPPKVEAYCHWEFYYPATCLKTGSCLEC